MKKAFFLLFLIKFSFAAELQLIKEEFRFNLDTVRYRFAQIEGHKGLDITNTAIISDRQGYLWVGTQDGLIRLDAYTSQRFTKSSRGLNAIAGNYVNALAYNPAANILWIGTSSGLSRLDLTSGIFDNYFSSKDSDGLADDFVQSLLVDSSLNVWVGTRNGLSLFEASSNRIQNITLENIASSKSGWSSVMDIQQDHLGQLWVATQAGILVLQNRQVVKRIEPLKGEGDARRVITRIAIESPKRIWIGTEQNGLIAYNPDDDSQVIYTHDNTGGRLPSNYIRALMMPNAYELWVGTDAGLSVFQKENNQFLLIDNNESLNENIVSLYKDSHGIYWVGTWSKGLHRYNPHETQIGRLSRDVLKSQDESLKSIVRGKDDDIWFSSFKTLYQLHVRENRVEKYHLEPINPEKNRAIPIWNPNDETLYLLTKDIYAIQTNNQIKKYDIPTEIRDVSWYGANFDSKGQLWLRSRTVGIFCLAPDLSEILHHIPATLAGFGKQIDESTMVFGTQQGSYFVDIDNYSITTHIPEKVPGMLNANITGFTTADDFRTWLGTSGGIHELLGTIHEPRYKTWTTEDGLPTDVLTGPLLDRLGGLWFPSTDGLVRFNPKTERVSHFDTQAGSFTNYYIGQYTKDIDDRLYFLGPSGISVVDQLTINDDINTYPVVVSDILIKTSNSKQTRIINDDNFIFHGTTDITQSQLSLPAENRDFTIEFTTTYVAKPSSVKYYYRLSGFDKNWNETIFDNRRATYTNIDPGEYVFEVFSKSEYGLESDIVQLRIKLQPYFYETWWFRLLSALALALIGFALYRYRVYKIQQYNLLLEKQVEQRTRDIHTLADIGRDITSLLEIHELSEHLYEHINRSLDATVLGIGIYQPIKQRIKFERSYEKGDPLPSYYKPMEPKSELSAWCIHHGKEIVLNTFKDRYRVLENETETPIGERMETVVYIPIISRNRNKLGCMTIQSSKPFAYSKDDLEFIRTIANYTSIALDNTIAHHELKRASYTDYLTSLPNRRSFLESAKYQTKVDARSKQPLTFAICDIDHFKHFNDTYGHDGGDYVLQRVAKVFKENIREQDIVARWGGEEFVFMLPNTSEAGATIALNKIRQTLEQTKFEFKGHDVHITATFGICGFSGNHTVEELIDLADSALYSGKAAGRNQVQVFDQKLIVESQHKPVDS